MSPTDPRYSLTELADLAGVTPRTVRYYMSQGLLPSPGLRAPARNTTTRTSGGCGSSGGCSASTCRWPRSAAPGRARRHGDRDARGGAGRRSRIRRTRRSTTSGASSGRPRCSRAATWHGEQPPPRLLAGRPSPRPTSPNSRTPSASNRHPAAASNAPSGNASRSPPTSSSTSAGRSRVRLPNRSIGSCRSPAISSRRTRHDHPARHHRPRRSAPHPAAPSEQALRARPGDRAARDPRARSAARQPRVRPRSVGLDVGPEDRPRQADDRGRPRTPRRARSVQHHRVRRRRRSRRREHPRLGRGPAQRDRPARRDRRPRQHEPVRGLVPRRRAGRDAPRRGRRQPLPAS